MKAKSISRDEAKDLLTVALAKGFFGELEQGKKYVAMVKRFYSDVEISHMVTEILTKKAAASK